nr:hypothetical protein NCPCFENI_01265 [Cupriavidus sp.]
MVVGNLTKDHALDHPERIRGAKNERCGSQQPDPEVKLHRCKNHHKLAYKPACGGQAGVGHGKQNKQGRELGHTVDHAAIIGDLPGMHTVVEHADTHKHGARDKPMGDHLHNGTLHA